MRRSLVVALLGLWLHAISARAETPDVARAREHFLAGQARYKEGQYPAALEEFQRAYQIRPNGVVRYNLARCYERMGDAPRALEQYRAYLQETPEAKDRAFVEDAIQRLEAQERERVQTLSIHTTPSGAQVSLDGEPRGAAPLQLSLHPGNHTLELSASGYEPILQTVTVPRDSPLQVDAALTPRPQSLAPVAQELLPTPRVFTRPPLWRWPKPGGWVYVAEGVAVAAGAVSIGLGQAANVSSRELRNGAVRTQPEAQKLADVTTGRAIGSNAALGIACAAAVSGALVYFFELRAAQEHPAKAGGAR